MGSGGVQGAVSFPTHITDFHDEFLSGTTQPDINASAQIDSMLNVTIGSNTQYGLGEPENPFYLDSEPEGMYLSKTLTDHRAMLEAGAGAGEDSVLEALYAEFTSLKDAIDTGLPSISASVHSGLEYRNLILDMVQNLTTVWNTLVYGTRDADAKPDAREYVSNIAPVGWTPEGASEDQIHDNLRDVVDAVDEAGILTDMSYSLRDGEADTSSAAVITQAISETDPNLGYENAWDGDVDRVVNKLIETGVLTQVDIATVVTSTLSSIATAFSQILGDLDTGIEVTADYESYVDEAVKQADTQGVLTNIDTSELVTAALSGSDTEIDTAVAKVIASIDATVIQNIITAYAAANEEEHAEAIRRYTGHMGDINAVQSSAFMFGLAHIYTQKSRDSARHGGQIQAQQIDTLTKGHIQTYLQGLELRLRAAITNKEARDRLVLAGITSQLQLVAEDHRERIAQIDAQTQNFAIQLKSRADGAMLNYETRERAVLAHLEHLGRAWQTEVGFRESLSRSFVQIWAAAFRGSLEVAGVNKGTRDQFVREITLASGDHLRHKTEYEMHMQDLERDFYRMFLAEDMRKRDLEFQTKVLTTQTGVDRTYGSHFDRMAMRQALVVQKQDLYRTDVAAELDTSSANIDISYKHRKWRWEVAQSAANVLAAPSGMAAVLPSSPSRFGQILGGALTGAAQGGQIGAKVGGWQGALIGAGAGLLLGGGAGAGGG